MSATSPNTLIIEASTNLLGVAGNDNRSNNVFQNLQFEHCAQEGIRLMGSANGNTIQNCVFSNNCQAIFLSGNSATIQSNTISDAYYQGAVLANMANGVFSKNTITNVGLNFGQHRPNFVGSFYSGGVWLINGNAGCVIGNNSIYNFTDDVAKTSSRLNVSPNTLNTRYYRLKIVDLDAKRTFSKVISLENNFILRGIKIYPNPVSDVLNIQNDVNSPFEIINISRQKMLTNRIGAAIDVSQLAKGTYILKINGQQTTFIKQ